MVGKVIFDISISLDGFITGANASPETGLGNDGERLHDWGFNSEDPRNHKIMEGFARFGANIFGRTGYDHSIIHWGADGPTGALRIPTIIVSHSVPQNVPQDGVYTFVDGVEAAHETAQKLAGDKDIYIAGANVAKQFLTRGFIDEIMLHVVPVLFGSGTRLFEGLDKHIPLETIEVIQTKEAIHTRFHVVK